MGRPRKSEEEKKATAAKKPAKKAAEKPAKKAASKKRSNETLATLAEIEAKLLKKAKNNGDSIDQSDIYGQHQIQLT